MSKQTSLAATPQVIGEGAQSLKRTKSDAHAENKRCRLASEEGIRRLSTISPVSNGATLCGTPLRANINCVPSGRALRSLEHGEIEQSLTVRTHMIYVPSGRALRPLEPSEIEPVLSLEVSAKRSA